MKKIFLPLAFYTVLALFFLRGILTSPGAIAGADWALPNTQPQAWLYGQQGFSTWTNSYNLFGARLGHLNAYPFNLLVYLVSLTGLSAELFSKIWLTTLLTLVGFSGFFFAKSLGLPYKASLLAGFAYLTVPPVFNYIIMGWYFSNLAMAIFPFLLLNFKMAVETGRLEKCLLSGVLLGLASIHAQALFLFPLVLLLSFPFLVTSRKEIFYFLKAFLVVGLVTFCLHAHWLIPFVIYRDPQLTQTISAYDQQRFVLRLNLQNIFRLWGSLFNYQFESSFPPQLLAFSYFLPLSAAIGFALAKKNRFLYFLACLATLPLLAYLLRQPIYHAPGAIVIRDLGRILILAALPYSIFTALAFAEGIKILKDRRWRGIITLIGLTLLLTNSLPFLNGDLSGKAQTDHDQRLRTINFPQEYKEAEAQILNNSKDTRALWLPSGQIIGLLDNQKFNGPFKELVDVYGLLSAKPGTFGFSDKTSGPSFRFGSVILDNFEEERSADLEKLLSLTPIENIVIRKDAYGLGGKGPDLEKFASSLSGLSKTLDRPKISIYANKNYLPHIYIPQKLISAQCEVEVLPQILNLSEAKFNFGIYQPDDSNREVGNRQDIFVQAKREVLPRPPIDTAQNLSTILPEASILPTNHLYFLVSLKEGWLRERAKGLDKADFYLWQASKRLVEAEKITAQGNTSKIEEALEHYHFLTREMATLLRNFPTKDEKYVAQLLKTQKYLAKDLDLLSSLESKLPIAKVAEAKTITTELNQWIANLWKKQEEGSHAVDIIQPGSYEVLIDKEQLASFTDWENLKLVTNGNSLQLKKETVGNRWLSVGEAAFSKGRHKLKIYLPESPNLISSQKWKENTLVTKKDGGISIETRLPANLVTLWQPIELWNDKQDFQISLSYKTEGGKIVLKIYEYLKDKTKLEEKETQEISVIELNSEGRWEKYERAIHPKKGATRADISLQLSEIENGNPGQIELSDLKITPVPQPIILLRMKKETSQVVTDSPEMTFAKINPTQYRVKIRQAEGPYTLAFLESYHPYWTLYQRSETAEEVPIAEERHLIINGYANAWLIKPEDVGRKENYELIVKFRPQKFADIGLFINIITWISCLSFLIHTKIKSRGIK